MAKVFKTNFKSYTKKFKALIRDEVKGLRQSNTLNVHGTKVLYLKDSDGNILAKAYKEFDGKMTLSVNSEESSITTAG